MIRENTKGLKFFMCLYELTGTEIHEIACFQWFAFFQILKGNAFDIGGKHVQQKGLGALGA